MKWKNSIDLVLLACENQEKIHYAMPVRSMLYDSLSYTEQIRYLHGLHKNDDNTITMAYSMRKGYLEKMLNYNSLFRIIKST